MVHRYLAGCRVGVQVAGDGSLTLLERRRSAVVVIVLVMAGVCVAQSFGRFTYGVVLPAVRDDLLGSNRVAGLLGTVNVTAYLAGTVVVAALSTRLALVPLMRIGLCFSTAGLLLASVARSGGARRRARGDGPGRRGDLDPVAPSGDGALRPERRGLAAGFIGTGVGSGSCSPAGCPTACGRVTETTTGVPCIAPRP